MAFGSDRRVQGGANSKGRPAGDLAARAGSAAVFALAFAALLWFGAQAWAKLAFLCLLAAAALMGAREAVMMGRKAGHFPSLAAAALLAWGLLLHCYLWGMGREELLPLWLVLFCAALAIHVGALFSGHRLDGALPGQGVTWLAGMYLGLSLGFQQKLFMFNDTTLPNTGARLLLALYLVVWLGDSCAYFAGRAFGRRRLAPRVSPGKTWEGLAGNLAGNLAGAAVAKLFVCTDWTFVDAAAVAVLLGACGALGDLAESAWKRSAGVKDSCSGIKIPGHGGLLDRMDSLALAAPALYAYVHFVHGLN